MRTPRLLAGVFSILILSLLNARVALANPLETELLELQNSTLAKRCANPCGYYGQICCEAGESCFTDSNNQAQCGPASAQTTPAPTGNGRWQYYTSTWVETNTVTKTSVYSSWVAGPAPTTPYAASSTGVPVNCNWAGGESSCGNICCPSGQYCQVSGQCAPAGSASAPLRPTSSGMSTVTQTSFSTTTTVPFQTPIATGESMNITQSSTSSGGGLSGGAIAGIVVGVIVGIILLILLCLCLCFTAAWQALVAACTCGRNRRRRETEVTEYESYHRSGHGGGQRTWYGGRAAAAPPPRRVVEETTEIRRTGGGWGNNLAVAMGFRRNQPRRDVVRRREEESDVSSYYYSDYTASE